MRKIARNCRIRCIFTDDDLVGYLEESTVGIERVVSKRSAVVKLGQLFGTSVYEALKL